MSANAVPPFHDTLSRLLRPLARMMVDQRVTISAAVDALKAALFAAAEAEGDVSDSRISLQTGLHRKDVKRLREATSPVRRKSSVNALAVAVSQWREAQAFRNPDGQPRDLPRKGTDDAPGFDDLVRAARIDLPAATVLDELVEQEQVEHLPDGRYRLAVAAYVPKQGSEARCRAVEATLGAHLATAAHNLAAADGEPRFFDRAVRYSHLSQASIDRLEDEVARRAQTLLEEINALAFRLTQEDEEGSAPANGRFVFGAFIHTGAAATQVAAKEE